MFCITVLNQKSHIIYLQISKFNIKYYNLVQKNLVREYQTVTLSGFISILTIATYFLKNYDWKFFKSVSNKLLIANQSQSKGKQIRFLESCFLITLFQKIEIVFRRTYSFSKQKIIKNRSDYHCFQIKYTGQRNVKIRFASNIFMLRKKNLNEEIVTFSVHFLCFTTHIFRHIYLQICLFLIIIYII